MGAGLDVSDGAAQIEEGIAGVGGALAGVPERSYRLMRCRSRTTSVPAAKSPSRLPRPLINSVSIPIA